MHPFDRFTPNAKLALQIAEQEAKNMKSSYIGTEHLLLGLLSIPKSLGFSIFTGAGVTLENVRILLKAMKSQDIEGKHVKHGLSTYLHNVIEQSVITAHKFRHANVGTEHLLHALVSSGKNAGTSLLEQMQVDPDDLKTHVEEMFGQINQFKQQSKNMEQSLESFFQGLQGAIVGMQGANAMEPDDLKRRKADGKSKTPVLDYFTDDLIEKAREGKVDPVIGRDKEIERVIHILNRKTKNNPVLIGEPGVGKTAIIEGLAQRIADGNVPTSLRNKRVLILNMGSLVAGTKYRGEFEQRFDDIIKEAIQCENEIILFIDELHTVVGAGSAEGSLDAANILKPALSRGAIQVVGATTIDEFKTIEKDRALERRFQSILVEEPSIPDTLEILRGICKGFEEFHGLTITDEALETAVQLSKRYITDRFLPDKAIDVLDETAAGKSLQNPEQSPELKKIEDKLEKLVEKQQDAVKEQKYHTALKLKQEQQDLQEQLDALRASQDGDRRTPLQITEDDIAHTIGRMTGIPVTRLLKTEKKRLQNLEMVMRKRVVGQDEAIKKVARAIRRSRVGIGDSKRPIGSFLFLGPTGVGKTELVRTIAEEVFNREDALIKIDMSEFMERHNVSRLIGATAGYVGYEEGGQLTEMVRRKPYSVVLFDEIEKAHPEFFNILLQILEDGVLTDGHGKQVDFRNTVIVMTSNIGAEKLTKQAAKIGFSVEGDTSKEDHDYEEKCAEVISELKSNVRPEFLNRIDHVLVFNALHQEHIRKIVKLHLGTFADRLKKKGFKLDVDQNVINLLAQEGFDPEYGARPVRRVIQERVEDEIAEHILKDIFTDGDTIHVVKKGKDGLDFLRGKAEKQSSSAPKKQSVSVS
ncbi:ATP-dependent Clp protease ATP-binding subunit ClpC [Candidatus Peregrinibacteria bacterium CG10_big_fil_rev_8_21_14_0_10_49_24]|nr:MAG: ATP-dependent Clp protease ATP-binding subunit ClpC [Candidatus Peregrinibacteria bacterium CG11_big_fil_rev_8_21_14_0_20_49_14]PIR51164.1 MAG: ATP-dependent Clp protease ATP-binding subunit ClpC [Candidatus Peregrinibacteria bacterium CG10_big_fil_rev_8_21_14_0_10_49_24]PJA67203.1 MAG: ATP-dependent Clp protease ATP-binding subunit ClpC [Candidatus Peregrinibacteria bacterium CG_4_9_14_3_um_filter_49_12]